MRAPTDGYTLLQVGTSHAVNTTLYKLDFDLVRDIAPVAGIARAHLVMLVHPSFPAKTIPEFISYAKANPGKINMASAGSGSSPRLAGELFKLMTGIHMVHVPYRGGAPAMSDLIAGQVQVMFSNLPAVEAPKRSIWRTATFKTIRCAFLKIAVRIEELKTRIKMALPSAYPHVQALTALATSIAPRAP